MQDPISLCSTQHYHRSLPPYRRPDHLVPVISYVRAAHTAPRTRPRMLRLMRRAPLLSNPYPCGFLPAICRHEPASSWRTCSRCSNSAVSSSAHAAAACSAPAQAPPAPPAARSHRSLASAASCAANRACSLARQSPSWGEAWGWRIASGAHSGVKSRAHCVFCCDCLRVPSESRGFLVAVAEGDSD